MDFYDAKFLLKNNVQDKIITNIFYQEKKESNKSKNNIGINLGKKRKLFENKKNNDHNFKISRTTTVSIKRRINRNHETRETCAICLDVISFENKHFLHCGHHFHCSCINMWINNGNNVCPICRGNIKCNNEDYRLINLDENENNLNNNRNMRNINRIRRDSLDGFYEEFYDRLKKLIIYIIIKLVFILIFFIFVYVKKRIVIILAFLNTIFNLQKILEYFII